MKQEIANTTCGLILAGGTGSRLLPMTEVINKHLIPVFSKPMVFYPIETLVAQGIQHITIVAGGNHLGAFMDLLGDGSRFGVCFTYLVQKSADGIAGALKLAVRSRVLEPYTHCATILGDNYFAVAPDITKIKNNAIFVTEHEHPERFGVVKYKGTMMQGRPCKHCRQEGYTGIMEMLSYTNNSKSTRTVEYQCSNCGRRITRAVSSSDYTVVDFVEKPKTFVSADVVTGYYHFRVSDLVSAVQSPNLKPSKRGEFEVVDVLRHMLKQKRLDVRRINGVWSDCGTVESLSQISEIIGFMERESRQA